MRVPGRGVGIHFWPASLRQSGPLLARLFRETLVEYVLVENPAFIDSKSLSLATWNRPHHATSVETLRYRQHITQILANR